MDRQYMLEKIKETWPDWEQGTHEEVLDDAISTIGWQAFDNFSNLDWQAQDCILNVFQAIRGQ